MHLFGKLQNQYEHLWKKIIRPDRTHYSQQNLGPTNFTLEGVQVERKDFTLTSIRNYKYQGSIWCPINQSAVPCVIYLHSTTGNRSECMEYLGSLIKQKIAVCGFDFCGCGNAQGQFISMGFHEQQNVQEVVDYVSNNFRISSLTIWGRSLGAVSALLYLGKTIDVKAVILDSPYKSLKSYIEYRLKKHSNIPSLVIGGVSKIVSSTIEEKQQFEIQNVNPTKNNVEQLNIPVLFICPTQDEYYVQSCKKLFDGYFGKQKKILKIQQKQDGSRTQECVNRCIKFLIKQIGQDHVNFQKCVSPKKQFDFFEQTFNEKHKKNDQLQVQQGFVIKQKQFPHFDNQHQEKQQHKSQFSLGGIFSFFTKKEQTKELESSSFTTSTFIVDDYKELRNRLFEHRDELKIKELKREELIEKKIRIQLKDLKDKKSVLQLQQWIYCSI